jgi:hypothetical protein
LDDPGGSVVMPLAIWITWSRERTLPRAIVPSWQDRHSLLEPVGCPVSASRALEV